MSEMTIPGPLPPHDLKTTQEWFGRIIGRRLMKDDKINPIAPSGKTIVKEAAHYIVPSPTLKPHQRIEIYNQQYWWRLLSTMQTNYPLVTRLFGAISFNQSIAVPFLLKYPPDYWSISYLGKKLPEWIQEEYRDTDKQLVYDAVLLDHAFAESFLADQLPFLDFNALSQSDPEALLSKPFRLQPHFFLLEFDYDLPAFREVMVKEDKDYWIEHPFPELKKDKTYHIAIFRNSKNNISWKDVGKEEFMLLQRFKEGISIEAACDWIEKQEASVQGVMEAHLQQWLQDWTRYGWLTS